MWQLIQEQFHAEVPFEQIKAYEQFDIMLSSGVSIQIQYNDQALTPERIYHLLAEGEYFNHDEKAREFLSGIFQVPIAGELMRAQFNAYTENVLIVASHIFDTIRLIEQSKTYQEQFGDPDTTTYKCIFCLSKQ